MLRRIVPGLLVLAAIGTVGNAVAARLPGVNALVVTIALGIVVGNAVGVPAWARPGVGTHKLWLEIGIVVMGVRVALDPVLAAGPTLLVAVLCTVAATVLLVEALARGLYGIPEKTGSLLAAGAGVCGVSAVVAVAESVHAEDGVIAYAAATVLLFDAVTLFVYPLIGHALGLSDAVFGVWAGLTMFSTGPVTAAGFAFSPAAGQWALLAKLTRNALIGVVAVLYAVYYGRRDGMGGTGGVAGTLRFLWDTFPKFVVGFLVVVLVANLGVLDAARVNALSRAANWAFALAFAGVGLGFRFDELRETGYRPALTVLTGLLVTSSVALVAVGALF